MKQRGWRLRSMRTNAARSRRALNRALMSKTSDELAYREISFISVARTQAGVAGTNNVAQT